MFFITGIVIEPEPTVLATEEPEYIPSSAEEITATFAGPPAAEPTNEFAKSTKKVPIPVFSRKEPKIIKITIKLEQTETYSRIVMKCTVSGKSYDLICTVSKNGVEICAEGKGDLEIVFPLFWFDGESYTEMWGTKNKAEVLYKGCVATYGSRNKLQMTDEIYANRNGYYKSAKVSGKNKVTLKIKLKKGKNNG